MGTRTQHLPFTEGFNGPFKTQYCLVYVVPSRHRELYTLLSGECRLASKSGNYYLLENDLLKTENEPGFFIFLLMTINSKI